MASKTANGAARAEVKKQNGFIRSKDAASFIVTNRGRNAYVHNTDGTTAISAVGSATFVAQAGALHAVNPTAVAAEMSAHEMAFPGCGWGDALAAIAAGELVDA